MNKARCTAQPSGFFHTSYFILHTSSKGQAITLAAFFFLVISLTLAVGIATPVADSVESAHATLRAAESLYAAQGASEDVLYRLAKGVPVDTTETLDVGAASAFAVTTAVPGGKEVAATGNRESYLRASKATLILGTGGSFHYGMQAGDGGIVLENSSSVAGNAYANGSIIGAGGNLVKGDAVSAGPNGVIDGIHATSSAYARTIRNSTVDRDAYYQTLTNTTVLGTLYPASPDQATSSMPIADAQIAEWESDAAAGGTISSPCPYKIKNDLTLGPKKVACDLEITGDPTVTLTGALWVDGNITVKNTATVRVSASLGGKSIPVIADKPSNRTTGSKITLENSAAFEGSGASPSFVLLVSQNRSAEDGGNKTAIDVKNSVTGDLLVYAGHGEVLLQNSIKVKEVSAYRIRLKNTAEVVYESGLANLIFTSGPSGGYVLDRWREVE